jgi:hypothetical protein
MLRSLLLHHLRRPPRGALAVGAHLFPEDRFLLVSDRGFRLRLCAPPNLKPGRPPRNWLERRWWLWGLAGG